MKTYSTEPDYHNFSHWAPKDDIIDNLPAWSCYCVVNWPIGGGASCGIVAYEYCTNCDGRGFMPVPPSELT